MVSPGSPEKLTRFLELNPTVPKDRIFVDDSENYGAFKAMKFGKLDGTPPPNAEGVSLKAPDLDPSTWFSYLTNVAGLSPIRGTEDGIPEGVTLLGGTLVFSGERMLWASADRIPGDYPAPEAVLRKVRPEL
mmetsp:Transcript_90638/g.227898  ORF Transcript_90638/g.227898 Transcript_90638/m.227898 type:complete len:132 (+) Transcript_90638:1180-1575(+)